MTREPALVKRDDVDAALHSWIDRHFDDQVAFLRELVRVPTDTPSVQAFRTRSSMRTTVACNSPSRSAAAPRTRRYPRAVSMR